MTEYAQYTTKDIDRVLDVFEDALGKVQLVDVAQSQEYRDRNKGLLNLVKYFRRVNDNEFVLDIYLRKAFHLTKEAIDSIKSSLPEKKETFLYCCTLCSEQRTVTHAINHTPGVQCRCSGRMKINYSNSECRTS